MSSLFYKLGKVVGPNVRKVNWLWQSMTASKGDAIRAEYTVGQDLTREIRNRLEVDTDSRAGQMLNQVGDHLVACVANKLRTFSFEAVKGDAPNAFALPGGFIFVTSSLLELCEWQRDEIAFILGHEMGHVIRGHAMDRIMANSAIAAGARTLRIRGPVAGWLGEVGVKFLQSAYSQDMELEADVLGARLAKAARYDPNGPTQLLCRLSELSGPGNQFDIENYFSSHPPFKLRIQNLDRLLSQRPT